jgi:hypothetical protein
MELQVGNPFPIRNYAHWWDDRANIAERRLHRRLREFASLAIGSHWKGSVSIGFQIDPGARATVTEGSLIPPCPISAGI